MKKWLLYGTAVTILAISIVISVVSYERSHHHEDESGILASGILDFAKRLHLADDEHPLHYEGGEHSFYKRSSPYSKHSATYNLYQRSWVVPALIGLLLVITLLYYASMKPVSEG
jgi:hypothetical protein